MRLHWKLEGLAVTCIAISLNKAAEKSAAWRFSYFASLSAFLILLNFSWFTSLSGGWLLSINSLTTPCISLTTCGLAAARLSFAVDPSVCIDLTDCFLLYRLANNRYFSPYKRIGLNPRCWGYAGNRLTDGGQICGNYPRREYFPRQTSENKRLSSQIFMWLALFLILQPRQQGNAIQLKVFWNADIGCIKSCRVEIHCGNQLVIITGLKFSFPPHKHWGVSTADRSDSYSLFAPRSAAEDHR